jgi:hypothetical protein
MSVRGIIVLQHITQLPGVAMVLFQFVSSNLFSRPLHTNTLRQLYIVSWASKRHRIATTGAHAPTLFSLRSDAASARETNKLRWEEKDQNLSIN